MRPLSNARSDELKIESGINETRRSGESTTGNTTEGDELTRPRSNARND